MKNKTQLKEEIKAPNHNNLGSLGLALLKAAKS